MDYWSLRGLLTDREPGGVEAFWNDMSQGLVEFAGSYAVSSHGNIAQTWIALGYSASTDVRRSAEDRVRTAVQATLDLKNPTNRRNPFYLDWRYFTGVIVLRDAEIGDGYLGWMELPTGNTLGEEIDCTKERRTGDAAGPREFQVIELPASQVNHGGLARAIGQSMGLSVTGDDRFTVMSDRADAYRFPEPRAPAVWGDVGPGLDSESLKQLGWLRDWELFKAEVPPRQQATSGTVLLNPLSTRSRRFRSPLFGSFVRVEVGPYSFECRTRAGWDQGIPTDLGAVVLARHEAAPTEPVLLTEGQIIRWGELREILGGGEVKIKSLSADGAVLEYLLDEGAGPIVAGGGTLHGGGTVLFTNDGRIVKIDPGDPYEKRVQAALDELEGIATRIERRGDS
jgi:hypothetical protein